MDISLTMSLLKSSIHTVAGHFKGSVSQNVDIGISFSFIVCTR